MTNYRYLHWLTFYGSTAVERIDARKQVDLERCRLRDEDIKNKTFKLLEFTNYIEEGFYMPDIDNGVEMPTEAAPAPKRRGRKPGSTSAPKKSSQAELLEAALTFVSPVENNINDFAQYVNLRNNMAIMVNGQIAAGHPIVEELTLCPHLDKLREALKRCGKTLIISETEAHQLSIKGDKIRALVPCWNDELPEAMPDAPILEGDFDVLKEAFKVCGILASEEGESLYEASLLLEPNTCSSTNRAAMLQYWHGISNLPPGTVLPKAFTAAVAKQEKKITGLGGNWNGEFLTSFTVWFDGGAWLKTQCYHDRWQTHPDTILNFATQANPVPEGLFDAIDAVTHFIDEEKSSAVHFVNDAVQSHSIAEVGAQYEVKGLPGGKTFNGKLIKLVGPWVKTIDMVSYEDKAFFFGGEQPNPVRGAIMCMRA